MKKILFTCVTMVMFSMTGAASAENHDGDGIKKGKAVKERIQQRRENRKENIQERREDRKENIQERREDRKENIQERRENRKVN